jgi:hypothetical protein
MSLLEIPTCNGAAETERGLSDISVKLSLVCIDAAVVDDAAGPCTTSPLCIFGFGFSCTIACGDFEEGHLIMYQLGVVLEMKPCDITLFPDSLITHKNTKVKGHRKSVVAFTQANMFEYWSCILLDVNVPWDGWSRIYSDGEKKTVGSSRAKVKKDPRECWRPKAKIMPGPCATRSGARY